MSARPDFFISYNRADRAWAEWIAWHLEEAGYTTFLQDWDFRPGGNWALDMQTGARAERTIAVLSPDYLKALYTQSEWAAAFAQDPTGERGTLLPVRVRDCELEGLHKPIIYIDLVGLDDETAAKNALLAGVKRERARPTVAPRFPGVAAPPRPIAEKPGFPGEGPGTVPFSRTDPACARQVIEKLLPDPEQRRAFLQLFAELVKVAHENPRGWGITLHGSEVILNVGGGYCVIWLHPGILKLFWQGKGVAEPSVAAAGSPYIPGSRSARGTPQEALRWVPGIRERMTDLIRRTNAKGSVLHGNQRKSHSPGVLRYIEEEICVTLPDPVYPQAIVWPPAAVTPPDTFYQMTQPRILRIVVASPGDVQAERDAVTAVAEELNRGMAVVAGLRIEIARWETDAYPGFHLKGPQGLIDPILRIEDCDLLIGIFWKRFGTPAGDAKSGTEHEFRIAYEAWKKKNRPQIMVYFNQKSYTPKSKAETEQWGQVLEFKQNFPEEGLWWPYNKKKEFERLVRNHLTQWIRQRITP